jgi:hypothetical protein
VYTADKNNTHGTCSIKHDHWLWEPPRKNRLFETASYEAGFRVRL